MTNSIKNKITAIVLAGGESSRMGHDKALLCTNGQTLLSRICLVASEVSFSVYVISPWVEKYQFVASNNCQLVKEEIVLNAKSNAPIIGFAQALELVKTEWVLLLACDLPYLSSSQVKQWSKSLTTVLPTEIAFLPRDSKGWQAVSGFYRRQCLPSLNTYIDRGGRSFQTWLAQYAVKELVVADRTCLFNCNTPEDWQLVKDRSS